MKSERGSGREGGWADALFLQLAAEGGDWPILRLDDHGERNDGVLVRGKALALRGYTAAPPGVPRWLSSRQSDPQID